MIPIETERLVIRNFTVSDWEALLEMIVQYQASEYAAYDQQWPTSAEEIKGITEWFASGDNFFAACLKDTSQFIGFVALNPEKGEDSRGYNIGYVFNSHYHGQGYATEACQAMLNQAFDRMEARKVISGTAAANRASCRLLERLGFRKIDERISSFKTAEDGKPIEFLASLYAISRDEWNTGQGRKNSTK